jgi:hypothetical protein
MENYRLPAKKRTRVTNSSDADTRCGEKIAHTLRLIALSLDETMLAAEMPWVSQRRGENFVFLSTFFKGQCFRPQGLIEAVTVCITSVVTAGGYSRLVPVGGALRAHKSWIYVPRSKLD